MESIVSQIFLIGPSYCLMKSRGGGNKIHYKFLVFSNKNKMKA